MRAMWRQSVSEGRARRSSSIYRQEHPRARVGRHLFALALVAFAFALVWAAIAPTQAYAQNRSLTLYNTHTHERLTVTYKRNGRFVQVVLIS